MPEEQEKQNTFAKMEAKQNQSIPEEKVQHSEPVVQQNEIDTSNFSDQKVGDKKSYKRPDLKGTTDTIDKFQVFPPNLQEEPRTTEKGDKEYWVPTMILWWSSKNEDDLQNKEYVSGAKVWKNDNRETNPMDIQFWYPGGAEADNQSCILWEKVASDLGVEPKEMSPRQFVSFLNSKPKYVVDHLKVKNYKASPGSPKFVYKNWPGEKQ